MKGAELPINIIIVFVLALAVLIAMIAVFMGVWTPGSAGIGAESAKNTGCQKYVGLGKCEEKTDSGSTIYIETVTCKCNEVDAVVDKDLDGVAGKKDSVEKYDVDNLEDLAKCCYGTTSAQLCC